MLGRMATEDNLKGRGRVIVSETNAGGWCGYPGDDVASFSSDDDQWDAEKPTNGGPKKTGVLPSK